MNQTTKIMSIALLALAFSATSLAAPAPKKVRKTMVVPDRFLREYDPITVFLPKAHGFTAGDQVDMPPDWLHVKPKHPGTWEAANPTTLQFVPTVPWPPLSQFTLTVRQQRFSLMTILDAPDRVFPEPDSTNLDPIRDLGFVFGRRIPIDSLAEMLTIEVRPLPGLDASRAVWLTSKDFSVKELARKSAKDPVGVLVTLNAEIPFEKKVIAHLDLCLDPSLTQSKISYSFSTRPLFRLIAIGAGDQTLPVSVSGGTAAEENAISVAPRKEPLFLEFNAPLAHVQLTEIKHMVRFQPVVDDLSFDVSGSRLLLGFDAEPDMAYQITLVHAPIQDQLGRVLAPFGNTSAFFFVPKLPPQVSWRQGLGIVERYGPQMLPMDVVGERQIDLRLHRIDPLDANLWPFPELGMAVDESRRPAGPGEEPGFMTDMAEQIRQLGTPDLSRVIELPLDTEAVQTTVGLDLKEYLAEVSGMKSAGTYLVGFRQLGPEKLRHYVRLQVTDLSLTVIEEESGVAFCVTSLKSGKPVSGARVTLEAQPERPGQRRVLFDATTNAEGLAYYTHRSALEADVFRIVTQTDDDILVLDPQLPPPQFYDNHWHGTYYTWMSWLRRKPVTRKQDAILKAHVFPERPVHRPEEPVHLKGYIRTIRNGRISLPPKDKYFVTVEGPGDREWTKTLNLTEFGSFYTKFDEKDLPTGDYRAFVRAKSVSTDLGSTTFKKESYRIPRFEVRVSGPDRTPLDRAFDLTATAIYYAGGRVVDHELTWEVTQAPYRFQPPKYPGFLFSTDTRFADGTTVDTSTSVHKTDRTDESGSSTLKIDPTQELNASPRTYHARVTVRGADEQTVTADKLVHALPPFIIGVKTDRLVADDTPILAQIVVLDFDGNELPNQELRVKFLHRQWHSYLRESDFTTGEAKYVTEVVDVPLDTQTMTSAAEPIQVAFPAEEAGVYLIEVSGKDRLGRRQKVIADLFVSGEEPVSWDKPKDLVLDTVWDRDRYDPGEEATLILKSPFQDARALVIVEDRDANRYQWVRIRGGKGMFRLTAKAEMAPKIPVHVLLINGRHDLPARARDKHGDLGKPKTLAATSWLEVSPKALELDIAVDHPQINLPGSTMPLTLTVTDDQGLPIDGEATIWLVDRAVLALGREGRLNPVPSFLLDGRAWIRVRDTRNQAVGYPNTNDHPGGDGMYADEAEGFFDRVTVRKNFKTVPFYDPSVPIVNGRAQIDIPLPDNLTDFGLRVVVTDGKSRFGAAKSRVSIRLPLIVQPALPRFVRPGDAFEAGGIGRVVEGEGGPGKAILDVDGLRVDGKLERQIEWEFNRPESLFFPMEVVQEASSSRTSPKEVRVRLGVERTHDQMRDAFEVNLPVRSDRGFRFEQVMIALNAGDTWDVPKPSEPVEQGTLHLKVTVSPHRALVKALAALDYLHAYDHGCLEQRISQVMPLLALRDLWQNFDGQAATKLDQRQIDETLKTLELTLSDNGLYAYWPGSTGRVHMTAYVVEFLLLARDAGIEFEPRFLDRGIAALKESLRSDYGYFVSGYQDAERTQALNVLAKAGELDRSYALELAARAGQMDAFSEAAILHTFLAHDIEQGSWVVPMIEDLWSRLAFTLHNGDQVYAGLQNDRAWGGPILSSETRTLAGMLKALILADPEDSRLEAMTRALIDLGHGDGWGSTQANAAAILALGETLKNKASRSSVSQVFWVSAAGEKPINPDLKPVSIFETQGDIPAQVVHRDADGEAQLVWLQMRYLPRTRGDRTERTTDGFVVSRNLLVFREPDNPPRNRRVKAGRTVSLKMGDVIEEVINVVNPEDRHYVAVRVPLAAGLEPLNPNLATAPPEAVPRGNDTRPADYALFEDDRVTFYFDYLPKGTYDFFFRSKASLSGSFSQPPARAEMMYQLSVNGRSAGCRIDIASREEDE